MICVKKNFFLNFNKLKAMNEKLFRGDTKLIVFTFLYLFLIYRIRSVKTRTNKKTENGEKKNRKNKF